MQQGLLLLTSANASPATIQKLQVVQVCSHHSGSHSNFKAVAWLQQAQVQAQAGVVQSHCIWYTCELTLPRCARDKQLLCAHSWGCMVLLPLIWLACKTTSWLSPRHWQGLIDDSSLLRRSLLFTNLSQSWLCVCAHVACLETKYSVGQALHESST